MTSMCFSAGLAGVSGPYRGLPLPEPRVEQRHRPLGLRLGVDQRAIHGPHRGGLLPQGGSIGGGGRGVQEVENGTRVKKAGGGGAV